MADDSGIASFDFEGGPIEDNEGGAPPVAAELMSEASQIEAEAAAAMDIGDHVAFVEADPTNNVAPVYLQRGPCLPTTWPLPTYDVAPTYLRRRPCVPTT